jgi:hypothetical protein
VQKQHNKKQTNRAKQQNTKTGQSNKTQKPGKAKTKNLYPCAMCAPHVQSYVLSATTRHLFGSPLLRAGNG